VIEASGDSGSSKNSYENSERNEENRFARVQPVAQRPNHTVAIGLIGRDHPPALRTSAWHLGALVSPALHSYRNPIDA
jgi:hypothetical protein